MGDQLVVVVEVSGGTVSVVGTFVCRDMTWANIEYVVKNHLVAKGGNPIQRDIRILMGAVTDMHSLQVATAKEYRPLPMSSGQWTQTP